MDMLQNKRGASVATELGRSLVLRAFTLTESMGEDFTGTVEMLSERDFIKPTELLGTSLTLTLETRAGERQFNGIVSRFEQRGGFGSDKYLYSAEIVPWTWLLGQRSTCRIYQGKTAKEIIEDVVKNAVADPGSCLEMKDLDDGYREREMCVQYNESDADFIWRLIAEEGIAAHFKHTAKGHTLVLSDWSDGFKAFPGYADLTYFPPESSLREDESISEWTASGSVVPGSFIVRDYDWRNPGGLLGESSTTPGGHPNGDGIIYQWPGHYTVQGDGARAAKIGREVLQAERAGASGRSDARGLSAGHRVCVDGFAASGHDGDYLVTSVTHSFHASDYAAVTGGGGQSHYDNDFRVADPGVVYRSARAGEKPRINGIQTAVVSGKAGKEIWGGQGDNEAHPVVSVHFHWDVHGGAGDGLPNPAGGGTVTPDEHSSAWVRVAQGLAGAGWGMQFLPRIGQEVVVQFIDGDPDRPLITGAVYNAQNLPPFALPANKTQSGIRTRSTKGGTEDNYNQLMFEDKKGEEKLCVQAERDMHTLVKNNETLKVGADRAKAVGGSETNTIVGNRTTNVGVSEGETPTVSDDVLHVTGNRSVSVDLDDTLAVEGGRVVTVSKIISATAGEAIRLECGESSITLKCSGEILIKGTAIQIDGGESLKMDAAIVNINCPD